MFFLMAWSGNEVNNEMLNTEIRKTLLNINIGCKIVKSISFITKAFVYKLSDVPRFDAAWSSTSKGMCLEVMDTNLPSFPSQCIPIIHCKNKGQKRGLLCV